ncbi:MAG: fluoride efflux transporter CrcB [Chlamydiae bacterium]|jgi:CrcB protein|nr:fluoride efflux transporter CrcB [Chlamydiota bacterium]
MIFLAIATGAGLGALLRFFLGSFLNSIFPLIPLGTLTANLLGGFLMGIFMALTKNHSYLPDIVRLGITTGFLGGLTTFSTFSAETVTLLANEEYLWTTLMILFHVIGSICLTITGIYTIKFFTS